MRSKPTVVFCASILAIGLGGGAYNPGLPEGDVVLAASTQCPSGTLFEPYTRVCAPVNDIIYQFAPAASATGAGKTAVDKERARLGLKVPNLDELRNRYALKFGLGGDDGTPLLMRVAPKDGGPLSEPPVPGGYGAGTTYKLGTHQALEQAVFHTEMFIHPDGIDSSIPFDWLMTPATNHTDSATEFVGMYAGHLAEGWFGIFGRPCTPEYPCPDGDTSNGWQAGWNYPFSEFECNTTDIVDHGGHGQKVMHYANETVKMDNEDPPLWRNSIYLWNYCVDEWDLIWRHEYRENKRDCSVVGCYAWGPILETFGTQGEINELGYEDSLLIHDGIESLLPPETTNFVTPIAPWQLLHLDPNRGYGAGNRYILAVPNVSIDIRPNTVRNEISLKTNKLLVVVLTEGDFDAVQVNPDSVRFGPAKAAPYRFRIADADGDGDADLMLFFITRQTGLQTGDVEASLSGETFDGQPILGTDSVKLTGGSWLRVW